MARHTVICSAGRRLDIQPCKTSPGLVQVQILGADRQVMASCTVDANAAEVLSQAFEIEASAAKALTIGKASCCVTPRPDCMGMLLPSIGNSCSALSMVGAI